MDVFKQVFGVVAGVFGLAGNGLVFLALWRMKNGWHQLNLQMTWVIAGISTLCCLVVMAWSVSLLALGAGGLMTSPWLCTHAGTLFLILMYTNTVLFSFMALDRYFTVVHNRSIKPLLGWLTSLPVIISLACLLLANAVNYGLAPDPSSTYCNTTGNGPTTTHLRRFMALTSSSSFLNITFCFTAIFFHCRKTLAIFNTMPRHCLVILVAYQLSALPNLITSFWELLSNATPPTLHLLNFFGVLLLQPLHPCLILGFQSALRREICHLRRIICSHPNRSQPTSHYSTLP
ncbi:hypothetical protein DSO57_1025179 [Entomophthora muscae]|uniref:Uncharacterized protein n=1 Tax=Entomophthora muscae TaxID=34485 RepID=A0ACC2TDK1_9FUNG|nr:hypothetical protein DSO57_1025179 [Entomophthora muscae]